MILLTTACEITAGSANTGESTMNIKFLLLCAVFAVNVSAADSPAVSPLQSQPLAAPVHTVVIAKPAAALRLPAPMISETSVTRGADGSLSMNCVQKPNPKLKQSMSAGNANAHPVGPQQP
jgi:hypothetical protein